MPSIDALRHGRISANSSPALNAMTDSRQSSIAAGPLPQSRNDVAIPDDGKPVASGNGVSVGINLAEPVLFLQGFDQNDSSHRSTAMLRGSLHLKVAKNAKIKAINLKFKGTAITRWPEGLSHPPILHRCTQADNIRLLQVFHQNVSISTK